MADEAPWGEVWGGGILLSPEKFRLWISNRRNLVQTGCFLYSSPKAGLNAVLVRRRPKYQTLSICIPTNKPAAERAATVFNFSRLYRRQFRLII